MAVGDFNGDGKPDLAVTNYYNYSVSVLLGNGDGTFQPHSGLCDRDLPLRPWQSATSTATASRTSPWPTDEQR